MFDDGGRSLVITNDLASFSIPEAGSSCVSMLPDSGQILATGNCCGENRLVMNKALLCPTGS
jgi:hypothetical protein